MLGVKREAERRPTGHARGLEVLVATREHGLGERVETARRIPEAARVDVRFHEENVELGLILDRALNPACLLLQFLCGLGDELLGDL